ncbi:MAG: molybdopterin molybdenumtransferase MoeA [Anaerolineaceae bacterium]|nr:molybdopterin molybdenumtransferase MoeA [Anaerolineaceae bacterium]
MTEFLELLTPDDAKKKIFESLNEIAFEKNIIFTKEALGYVFAKPIISPESIPSFERSTVDGYAVKSRDTYGASESLPAFLRVTGEIIMGKEAEISIDTGEAALIHTGGMLPQGADSVVMIEFTDKAAEGEISIYRPVGINENVVKMGEDVKNGDLVFEEGKKIRPGDIGGLMALGITQIEVYKKPIIGIISTGDEVINPEHKIKLGQVRDINSYTLKALVEKIGAIPKIYGIVSDNREKLEKVLKQAHQETDMLIVTAGSSASTRDLTSEVVQTLGKPGVLVHGINVRPGKPTILAVCDQKPVVGLPGNPVSAFVIANLFVTPIIYKLMGITNQVGIDTKPAVTTLNISSVSGREDWVPVKLVGKNELNQILVEPIFYKSNLIFSIIKADGLIKIPEHLNGIPADSEVELFLL